MTTRVLSLRLLPKALERLDQIDGGRSVALRHAVERVASGHVPDSVLNRDRVQVSARLDADLVDRAREEAAKRGVTLAAAVEEVLLHDRQDW